MSAYTAAATYIFSLLVLCTTTIITLEPCALNGEYQDLTLRFITRSFFPLGMDTTESGDRGGWKEAQRERVTLWITLLWGEAGTGNWIIFCVLFHSVHIWKKREAHDDCNMHPQKGNPKWASSWTFLEFASTVSMVMSMVRTQMNKPKSTKYEAHINSWTMHDKTFVSTPHQKANNISLTKNILLWGDWIFQDALCSRAQKKSERFISFQTTHF